MTTAYLGLGSNMDNPPAQLEAAIKAIEQLPTTSMKRRSPQYASKAWGKTDQADFLNMVIEIETELEPHLLLQQVKRIEAEQGRKSGERWGPRPVDIDILLYGDYNISTTDLIIPHTRMWERAFVLRPLFDLDPDLIGPNNLSVADLLKQPEIAAQGVWPTEHDDNGEANRVNTLVESKNHE